MTTITASLVSYPSSPASTLGKNVSETTSDLVPPATSVPCISPACLLLSPLQYTNQLRNARVLERVLEMTYSRVSQISVLELHAIETPGKLKLKMQIWEPNARSTRSEFGGQGLGFCISNQLTNGLEHLLGEDTLLPLWPWGRGPVRSHTCCIWIKCGLVMKQNLNH